MLEIAMKLDEGVLSSHPKALANMAKHLAFTRCGELNLHGMVEAEIAVAAASCWRETRLHLDHLQSS